MVEQIRGEVNTMLIITTKKLNEINAVLRHPELDTATKDCLRKERGKVTDSIRLLKELIQRIDELERSCE